MWSVLISTTTLLWRQRLRMTAICAERAKAIWTRLLPTIRAGGCLSARTPISAAAVLRRGIAGGWAQGASDGFHAKKRGAKRRDAAFVGARPDQALWRADRLCRHRI